LDIKKLYRCTMSSLREVADFFKIFNWQNLEKRELLWLQTLFLTPQEMVVSAIPWWPYTAANYLETYLEKRPHATVFEWGSGASTRWLASRASRVTSIEHDAEWFQLLQKFRPVNANVKLVRPTHSANPRTPSLKKGFSNMDFDSYVKAINSSLDKYDLIIIDGRSRMGCMEVALSHLKEGGIIFLDNSKRMRYSNAKKLLGGNLKKIEFSGLTPASPIPTFSTVFLNDSSRTKLERSRVSQD